MLGLRITHALGPIRGGLQKSNYKRYAASCNVNISIYYLHSTAFNGFCTRDFH